MFLPIFPFSEVIYAIVLAVTSMIITFGYLGNLQATQSNQLAISPILFHEYQITTIDQTNIESDNCYFFGSSLHLYKNVFSLESKNPNTSSYPIVKIIKYYNGPLHCQLYCLSISLPNRAPPYFI